MSKTREHLYFYILPCLCFMALAFLVHEVRTLDMLVTKHISFRDGFLYRDSLLFETLLHKMAAKLSIVFFVILFIAGFFAKKETLTRKKIFYVFWSSLFSISVIALLKMRTTIPCPWSLKEFGGESSFVHFWQMFSADYPRGHCFPAGHSSGGFALISLFYANLIYLKKIDYKLLIPGLFIGALFGLTQQVRGAHLLSHDLATISICILINYLASYIVNWRISEKN